MIDRIPEIRDDPKTAVDTYSLNKHIAFDGVTFAYPVSRKIKAENLAKNGN